MCHFGVDFAGLSSFEKEIICATCARVSPFTWTLPSPAERIPKVFPWYLINNRINDWLYETSRDFGFSPWAFKQFCMEEFVVVSSPRDVEHILSTNFSNYVKGKLIDTRFNDLFGKGILNSDGPEWQLQRSTAEKLFCNENFHFFADQVFRVEMVAFMNHVSSKEENCTFDLRTLLLRFALNSFLKICFGVDIFSFKIDDCSPYSTAFDRALRTVDYRLTTPFWYIEELFGSRGTQMRHDLERIRSFGAQLIQTKKQSNQWVDLLSLFRDLRDKYSDEDINQMILNYVIAGRDSTAHLLCWAFYALERNPEAKSIMIEEIDRVLGHNQLPEFNQIKDLKYTRAVIFETLRLYPSVPKGIKTAVNNDILPSGTKIPKGTNMLWSSYTLGRMESIWGSDFMDFKPSRWLKGTHPSDFEYPVFNAGPRICLGKGLAEMECPFFLASFYRNFDVSIANLETVDYQTSFTLTMSSGLFAKINQRVKE